MRIRLHFRQSRDSATNKDILLRRHRLLAVALLLAAMTGCGGGSSNLGTPQPLPAAVPGSSCDGSGTGVAVLSWDPPTTNEDDSPVDLVEFRIFCATNGVNPRWAYTAGPLDTQIVIKDLPEGTHYFSITAVSRTGVQSDFSNVEVKTIESETQP